MSYDDRSDQKNICVIRISKTFIAPGGHETDLPEHPGVLGYEEIDRISRTGLVRSLIIRLRQTHRGAPDVDLQFLEVGTLTMSSINPTSRILHLLQLYPNLTPSPFTAIPNLTDRALGTGIRCLITTE